MKKIILNCFLIIAVLSSCTSHKIKVKSPSGNISVEMLNSGVLSYSVNMDGKQVVMNSPLGLQFEGVLNPSGGFVIEGKEVTEINETYPTRGKHFNAVEHCNYLTVDLLHKESGDQYKLQVRVFNDGIAIRYMVDGIETFRIAGESTGWMFPDGATAWLQDSEGKYMEKYNDDGFGSSGHHQPAIGNHQRVYQAMYFEMPLNLLEETSIIGGPVLLKLPESGIFVWMAEASLLNYPGSRFLVKSPNNLGLTFPEKDPWSVQGPFTTPWRLLVLSNDLNGIVNTDMHTSVCPPPSDELASADWIKPGRATWSWYSGTTGDMKLQKQYADWAAELGFEYNLIDAGWEELFTKDKSLSGNDPWDLMKQLVDYALNKGVQTWVWQHSRELKDPVKRKEYFENLSRAGISGVKIDFFDTESKETIDYMTAILEEAVGYKIMLNFHGAPKPTGLSRTYPHEMCREANRGSEWHTKIWGGGRELTPRHNVITVFTRDVLGNNDFTPVIFDSVHLQGFTRTHQMAQAICYTSPVTHWCDQPQFYIESGVKDIISSIPTLWEKTIVLEPSDPGKLAVIARFDGKKWFLGVMNGEKSSKEIKIDLGFLGSDLYDAVLVGDDPNGNPLIFDRTERQGVTDNEKLTVQLSQAGGYVARFTPVK